MVLAGAEIIRALMRGSEVIWMSSSRPDSAAPPSRLLMKRSVVAFVTAEAPVVGATTVGAAGVGAPITGAPGTPGKPGTPAGRGVGTSPGAVVAAGVAPFQIACVS